MKGVVGENLRKALDWLPQGRRLVTVATDCDLAGHVPGWPAFDALAFAPIDPAALAAFYDRYGFKSMKRELEPPAAGSNVNAVRLRIGSLLARRIVSHNLTPCRPLTDIEPSLT